MFVFRLPIYREFDVLYQYSKVFFMSLRRFDIIVLHLHCCNYMFIWLCLCYERKCIKRKNFNCELNDLNKVGYNLIFYGDMEYIENYDIIIVTKTIMIFTISINIHS